MFVYIDTLILTHLYALWLVLTQVLLSLSVPNMLCENRQAYMNKILYVRPMIMFFNKSSYIVISDAMCPVRVLGSTCIMTSLYSFCFMCKVMF